MKRWLLCLTLLLTPLSAFATAYTATATNLVMHQGDSVPPLIFTMSAYAGSYSSVFNGQPSLSTTATPSSVPGTYPIIISAGTQSPVSGSDTISYVNGTLTIIAADTNGAQLKNSVNYPPGFFGAPAWAVMDVTSNPVATMVGNGTTLNDRAFERLLFFSRWGADATVNTATSGGNCALTWVSGTGFTGIAAGQPLRINGVIYTTVSVTSNTSMTVSGTCPTQTNADARLPWNTVSVSGTTVTATAGPSFAAFTAQSITEMVINGVTYTISTVTDATHATLSTAPPATSDADAYFGSMSSSAANIGARPLYLYFPSGTYLLSQQEYIPGSDWNFFGQGPGSSILKLAPNSAQFQSTATQFLSPQSVNFNQNFREHIYGLGIELGVGNAFAEGLTWLGNNEGAVRNTAIWSDDSNALYCLNLTRSYAGPSIFEDLSLYGCQYGMSTTQNEYGLVFEKLTLEGQTVAGMDSIGGMKLWYRRLLAYEPPAAYVFHPHNANSEVALLDSEIIANGTPSVPALFNSTSGSSIYTHNVSVAGYSTSLSDAGLGSTQTWTGNLIETWTGTAQTLFDSGTTPSALHLPVLETPSAGDDASVSSWTQLGSNPTTWQATINSSSSPTVYLPPGQYASSAGALTLNIPDTINHIQFFHSKTPGGTPYTINITVSGSSSTPLIVDGCLFNNCYLTQNGTRAVAARDGGYINYTSATTANLFIDDALVAQDGNPLTIPTGQRVWARQLDLEQTAGKHLVCNSCTMWVLGYKTEHNADSMADVTNGSLEEIGGFWYMLSPPASNYTLFNVNNANFFTTGQAFVNTGDGAPNQVIETRTGVTRNLPSPQTTNNQQLPMFYAFGTDPVPWSSFIDSSRAIDWTSAGFTIPNYTTNCATQPSLAAGTGAASANATAIQNALNSCDATHNVVKIPAGTWYVNAFQYGANGHQVLRGAGTMSTTLVFKTSSACGSGSGICMVDPNGTYSNGQPVLPGGSQQCAWTGGYAKGTTTITLTSCGGTPPLNQMLILDQANDGATDTGGVYVCDNATTGCTVEAQSVPSGNGDGRVISNVTHSLQQVVLVTGVTSNGGGSYTVTISPGVDFTNIRSGQTPGAFWTGFVQNDGIENMTLDHSQVADNTSVNMFNCYQCWVKNIRSLNADRDHVWINLGKNDVVRDSYFYGTQTTGSQSYAVELEESSGVLIENNIFQQVTNPLMFGQSTGTVVDYNYSIDNVYSGGSGQFVQASYAGHNAGNTMNLWEGNNFVGIWSDANWGSSFSQTLYRNMLIGFQRGKTENTTPILFESWSRGYNVIGNVLGQPGYNTTYQSYATSNTGGVNGYPTVNTSIYGFGWTGSGGSGQCNTPPFCDAKVFPSTMRWGNWDTANNATQWNATEASPASIPYINANFTSSYFSSLAHTLPASLYYTSTPSWWPSGKAWPPIGPDVSAGNLGICSGTYAGAQATSSAQCGGGSLASAWASHATSIPAQDCYLSVMNGPPDGTGSALSFDANTCYASAPPPPPTTPVFTPGGGPYSSPQSVSITSSNSLIFYTNDGNTPTPASTPYSAPIPVNTTTTLGAISAAGGSVRRNTQQLAVTNNSSGWKICTPNGGGPGTPTSVACGGVGTTQPSNWSVLTNTTVGGIAGGESISVTASSGAPQILVTLGGSGNDNATELTMDKWIKPLDNSGNVENQELDGWHNDGTRNRLHMGGLQCNQQSAFLQWQIDNEQGSWQNTGIKDGCPLSTTLWTHVRYDISWTIGDTGCGGLGCTNYNYLDVCQSTSPNIPCTFNHHVINMQLESDNPGWGAGCADQDQVDLRSGGTYPKTGGVLIVANNVTCSFGTSATATATYQFPVLNPIINFSGQIQLAGQIQIQ